VLFSSSHRHFRSSWCTRSDYQRKDGVNSLRQDRFRSASSDSWQLCPIQECANSLTTCELDRAPKVHFSVQVHQEENRCNLRVSRGQVFRLAHVFICQIFDGMPQKLQSSPGLRRNHSPFLPTGLPLNSKICYRLDFEVYCGRHSLTVLNRTLSRILRIPA